MKNEIFVILQVINLEPTRKKWIVNFMKFASNLPYKLTREKWTVKILNFTSNWSYRMTREKWIVNFL